MRTTVVGTVILMAWLAWPAAASAQTSAPNPTDRWAPWVGCWSLTTEDVREGAGTSLASALVPDRSGAPAPINAQKPQICVARFGDGVVMTTTVPDQPATTQTIVADGSPHEFVDGDCRGTERTEWSKAGKRLIARADVKCADKMPRVLTGLGLITREGYWLDIRSLRIDGQDATRVSRFRRVSGTRISGQPLSIDEIKEATAIVSSTVVEAAVAETRPQFDMNKKMLKELAAANVPSNVIDVMVATSYPDKFVVEKQPPRAPAFGAPMNSTFFAPSFTGLGPCLSTGPYVRFDQDYCGTYGYQYFGSSAPGHYNRYYDEIGCCFNNVGGGGGGAVVVPVTPVEPSRAINGQGYTRIHPVEQASGPTSRTGGNGTQSINSGGSSGGGSTGSMSSGGGDSGSSSSGSSGGGGSASPSGFSGGGGGDGGRTAVPR